MQKEVCTYMYIHARPSKIYIFLLYLLYNLYNIVVRSVEVFHRHVTWGGFFFKGGLYRNTRMAYIDRLLPITMPTYGPRYCESCQTCLQPLFLKGNIYQRCKEREQIPKADRTHDRCSTYKCIRPVCDFPLDRNNNQYLSYALCLA
jgi:hypothetical protein